MDPLIKSQLLYQLSYAPHLSIRVRECMWVDTGTPAEGRVIGPGAVGRKV